MQFCPHSNITFDKVNKDILLILILVDSRWMQRLCCSMFKKKITVAFQLHKDFCDFGRYNCYKLIAVIAVWINHNLFFTIKNGDNGNDINTCQNCFVAAVCVVADLYLKSWCCFSFDCNYNIILYVHIIFGYGFMKHFYLLFNEFRFGIFWWFLVSHMNLEFMAPIFLPINIYVVRYLSDMIEFRLCWIFMGFIFILFYLL
jgi:hypothetical protein